MNASQRSSRRGAVVLIAALVVVGVLALLAILAMRGGQLAATPTLSPSASPRPSPTATAPQATAAGTTSYQSPLGYSVQLPSGWRRSDLQSRTSPNPQGDPDLLGTELFTRLSPADEEAAMRRSDTGVGPALEYTASVGLYRNSRNLSAMAFADRQKGAFGLNVVSIEPATVDGRAGAKTTFKFTTNDPTSMYALYVPDGERMWVIGYFTAPPGTAIPAGATEPAVRGIVESFRFAR